MRRLCGSSASRQPRAAPCASAAAASGTQLGRRGISIRDLAAQRPGDARAHFCGRLAREGDRQDLACVLDRAQELQEALRQHGGLARAGGRFKQHRDGRVTRLRARGGIGTCGGLTHRRPPRGRALPRRRDARRCGTGHSGGSSRRRRAPDPPARRRARKALIRRSISRRHCPCCSVQAVARPASSLRTAFTRGSSCAAAATPQKRTSRVFTCTVASAMTSAPRAAR